MQNQNHFRSTNERSTPAYLVQVINSTFFEANFNNIFKEDRHLVQRQNISYKRISTKTASSLIKSISINVFLPQGRDWPFLVILGSSNQHVTIRTSPDLFEINNNEALNEEIWRHKLYHHLYIVYVSKLDWVHLIYLWNIFQSKTQTPNIENKLSIKATDMKIISQKIISQRKANQFKYCILIRSYTTLNISRTKKFFFPYNGNLI